MKLHCDISIHVSHGGGEYFPRVTIRDRLSGVVVLEAEMTMEDYAKAVLTNLHSVPCEVYFNDSGDVGKKCERKDEVVWVPDSKSFKDDARLRNAEKHLKPFEVDGWVGSASDACNHHNFVRRPPPARCQEDRGSWYRVSFHRFVEATDADREAATKRDY